MKPAFPLLRLCRTTPLRELRSEVLLLRLVGQQRSLFSDHPHSPRQSSRKSGSIHDSLRTFTTTARWHADTKRPSSVLSRGSKQAEESNTPSHPTFMMGPPPGSTPSEPPPEAPKEEEISAEVAPEGLEEERHKVETELSDELQGRGKAETVSSDEPQETEAMEKASISAEQPHNETDTTLPPPPRIKSRADRARNAFNNVRTRVRMEDLPSHAQKLRSDVTKRFSKSMDHMMRNLNVASQRLNIYTGTDYSGINALRSEIMAQESIVRESLDAVNGAKGAHDASFAAQAASQKEVVQLLERKHSWSAADLERYMQLIRNEHVNDTRVQDAKAALAAAERKLEDERARLEKIERKQYHEEQIWSDTIRRNSTWVTFGLMGFNIVLLLLSLLILEPWRRRRMVREIRTALNEKMDMPAAFAAAAAAAAATSPVVADGKPVIGATAEVEDAVVPTIPTTPASSAVLEEVQPEAPLVSRAITSSEALITVDASGPEVPLLDEQSPSAPASTPHITLFPEPSREPTPLSTVVMSDAIETPDAIPDTATQTPPPHTYTAEPLPSFRFWSGSWSSTWTLYRAYWADLFSERSVDLRKVDVTATALEGAAAGAAAMGLLFVLFRPR